MSQVTNHFSVIDKTKEKKLHSSYAGGANMFSHLLMKCFFYPLTTFCSYNNTMEKAQVSQEQSHANTHCAGVSRWSLSTATAPCASYTGGNVYPEFLERMYHMLLFYHYFVKFSLCFRANIITKVLTRCQINCKNGKKSILAGAVPQTTFGI